MCIRDINITATDFQANFDFEKSDYTSVSKITVTVSSDVIKQEELGWGETLTLDGVWLSEGDVLTITIDNLLPVKCSFGVSLFVDILDYTNAVTVYDGYETENEIEANETAVYKYTATEDCIFSTGYISWANDEEEDYNYIKHPCGLALYDGGSYTDICYGSYDPMDIYGKNDDDGSGKRYIFLRVIR